MYKKTLRRMLSAFLVLLMLVDTIMPTNLLAQETKEVLTKESRQVISKNYYDSGLEINFQITSQWESAFNGMVTVHNVSKQTIRNWAIQFDTPHEITNIWNGIIYEYNDYEYIIKNNGYNERILSGESINFGFTAKLDGEVILPDRMELVTEEQELPDGAFAIEYQVTDQWNTGMCAALNIQNTTDEAIEEWTLGFDYAGEITNIWNADIVEHTGDHYLISNRGYNYKIDSGTFLTIGFQASFVEADAEPAHYTMHHFVIAPSKVVTLEDGEIDKDYYKIIVQELLLRGLPTDSVKLSDDYDQDGLSLQEEYEYDTNPFIADSDEDGLNDWHEIMTYQTDPNDEDTDGDLMSDGTEIASGLNPLVQDSDGDGVLDNEECVTQHVRLNFIGELDGEEFDTVPAVTITGAGDFSQKLYAEPVEHDETILDIDCLVGTPYDFAHDEELNFESAEITFTLSEEVLADNPISDLVIAWYNEEDNSLEPIETLYDETAQTLSAQVDHFSIYMVINTEEFFYYGDSENASELIESGKADIVFVMDTTGSMAKPIENVKENVAKFVKELESQKVDARFGLIEFKDIYQDGNDSTRNYGWFTSAKKFTKKLSALTVDGGGGDGPETPIDALESACQMKYRTGVDRYIILLTDAHYLNGTSTDSSATFTLELEKLSEKGIVTSVVTKGKWFDDYENAVSITGGVLADITSDFCVGVSPLTNLIGKSASGGAWIRLSNNSVVHLDKNPALEDAKVDTDKDGVPDAEELVACKQKKVYNPYTKKYQVMNVWTFHSNPAKKDTDGDGFSDGVDLEPKKFDVAITKNTDEKIVFNTGRTWYHISCTSFDFLDNAWSFVDNSVRNPMPKSKFKKIFECYQKNDDTRFNIAELTAIGLLNNEGSKLYMDAKSKETREKVFQNLTGRSSRRYQHKGVFAWGKWEEVPRGTKGGFWKGKVLSEADINFSNKVYKICDVYRVIESIASAGAAVVIMVVAIKATPVVLAHVEALEYYCETYGIRDGIDMYCCLGRRYLPDGVISVVQMDMQDGDSDILDTVAYADEVARAEEDVWMDTAVIRGKKIDRILGNNLGDNFPVVDRLENGKLISIKSIDLSAKTYQTQSKLYGKLAKDVRALDGFTGKRWAKKVIMEDQYTSKALQIAIPRMTITKEQKMALDAVKLYAEERKIDTIITVVTKK